MLSGQEGLKPLQMRVGGERANPPLSPGGVLRVEENTARELLGIEIVACAL